METVTLEMAQAKLTEIVHRLAPGEEIVIMEDQHPVAKLVRGQAKLAQSPRPGPGLCKGIIVHMAADFDAPLEDMKEYME